MKQVFKYASLLFVAGALLVTSCKKKTDDAAVTPVDPVTTPPSGESVCLTSKKTVSVVIDASTKDGATGFTKSYSCSALTSDTISLDLKVKGTVGYLYMKKVDETNAITNYSNTSNVTKTVDGNTVSGGNTNYSYQLPSKDASNNTIDYKNSALKLKIPITKRTSGSPKYDIYTFWITSSVGTFENFNKKNTFGPITVTLVYGSDKPIVSTQASISLADQNVTGTPSYLTSSPAGISTLSGASLLTGEVTPEEKKNALNGADINFVSLNSDASACGTENTPYFIGVGTRATFNTCLANTEGTNITKFAKFTLPSGKTFATLSADDITGLTTPSATKMKVENDSYYVYLTQDGRKGIIHTSGLTIATTGTAKATVNVDVVVVVQ